MGRAAFEGDTRLKAAHAAQLQGVVGRLHGDGKVDTAQNVASLEQGLQAVLVVGAFLTVVENRHQIEGQGFEVTALE